MIDTSTILIDLDKLINRGHGYSLGVFYQHVTLRFFLSQYHPLYSRDILLYSNVLESGVTKGQMFVQIQIPFVSSLYPSLYSPFRDKNGWYADLVLDSPGCFEFRVESHKIRGFKTGNFVVTGMLDMDGEKLNPRILCVMSCLTKAMGKLSDWDSHFHYASRCGKDKFTFDLDLRI